jgi:hypothetical protein
MGLVVLTELLSLASEVRQLVRKGLAPYCKNPWNVFDSVAALSLLVAAAGHFVEIRELVRTFGAVGVAVRVIKTLDYLRAFERTGPLVRMLIVITVDIIPFLSVLMIAIVAATLFFMINMPDSEAFSHDPRTGVLWPFFTVFRAALGDSDVDEYTTKAASAMFFVFSLFVMVLMLNLLIAIMGDSYDKVQARLGVEGLFERAKMIVDAEQVQPGRHWYPDCLHIKQPADIEDQAPKEQVGITGRVKQDMDKLQAAMKEQMEERLAESEKKTLNEISKLESKLNRIIDVIGTA